MICCVSLHSTQLTHHIDLSRHGVDNERLLRSISIRGEGARFAVLEVAVDLGDVPDLVRFALVPVADLVALVAEALFHFCVELASVDELYLALAPGFLICELPLSKIGRIGRINRINALTGLILGQSHEISRLLAPLRGNDYPRQH